MTKRTSIIYFAIIPFAIFIDRLLKRLADRAYMDDAVQLLPWVKFTYFANHGIAFGIPISGPVLWLLSFGIIALFTGMALRGYEAGKYHFVFGYALVITGGISNYIDRIFLGHVIDYLVFFERSAINVADLLIITGTLILLFSETPKIILKPKDPRNPEV